MMFPAEESIITPKYLMHSFSLRAFLLILMVTCFLDGLIEWMEYYKVGFYQC